MKKIHVLFICIHNSARSQMAEAFTNQLGAGAFIAESAGLEPGKLNPVVVEVMQEIGIDLSNNRTVCDAKNAERCPVFPGKAQKIAWMFDDPSQFQGTPEEKKAQTRKVRDAIKSEVAKFITSASL